MSLNEFTTSELGKFSVTRRYFPHLTDYDAKYDEAQFRRIERRLSFPAARCALVLLDVWNKNEIGFERFDRIVKKYVAPVADAFREAGMLVVHAPSPPVAAKYPDRRFKPGRPEDWLFYRSPDGWPTPPMIARTGEFAPYSLTVEENSGCVPQSEEALYRNYFIHPSVGPVANDVVIGDRNELHALLKDRQIFHIFYAGFSSNGCMLERDYGVKWVSYLGYDITLIRDCTGAVEMSDTVATLEQTRTSVQNIELWISTCSAEDLLDGLRKK